MTALRNCEQWCCCRTSSSNVYLVNIAEDSRLNALVLDNLSEDTTVATTDDEDLLGVGVRHHAEVGDHLLVGELVTLSALNDVVEDENIAVVGGLEDEDILVLALLVVEDLLDAESHGLAWWEGLDWRSIDFK